MRTRTGGIVLCGGLSSRMGRPKCWLPVGGEPMLLRVLRVVSAVGDPVVVVAAAGQELPTLPDGVAVVRDEAEGNGPLQGLAAGLAALAGRADAAVVTGCDCPLLSSAVLRRLVEIRADASTCVTVTDDIPRPLPGVYAVAVLAEVRALLAAGRLRLGALFEHVPTRLVTPSELADIDPQLRSLRNVNTPDEYARLLSELGPP
ncbi:molybdenum cofactor guanylyltransferase [Urbifossiella limnaea]|uniref:Probable molybdenum cofactor guanylyltransferase n=1 Tax=Urbifossiella limnaea TaxID=2528023 RepID=A0A517XUC7_9BACT|nr:molybdenum cofactor guanylyltransferase [Urbifossiella limnaea]QDU21086.1 putative molybdenum cofactor guanylyltransferase [Urbifossiella limnaea]